jgi:subtilisin family serine protease
MTGRRKIFAKFLLALTLLLTISFSEAQTASSIPLIVKLAPGAPLLRVLDWLSGSLVDSIPGSDMYLVNVPKLPLVQPVLGLLTNTLQLVGIDWFEVNDGVTEPSHGQWGVIKVAGTTPADWYKNQPSFQLIRAGQAQSYSTGRGVIVADINSRVDYSHPALRGHLIAGYDFVTSRPAGSAALNQSSASFLDQSSASFLDQSSASFLDQSSASFLDQSSASFLDDDLKTKPAMSHGTLTVGVIAAMAPDAMIMPVRAFDDDGEADLFILAKAIRYATDHGAQVINMSFGTLDKSKAIQNSIDYAKSKGVFLVASAGNNNTSAVQYPAAFSGVFTAAATDLNDKKASFSNYGGYIFADAPGVNIISTFPQGYYAMVSGTSFTSPELAATVALVRSIKTTAVTNAVANAAVNIDSKNPSYAYKLGNGRIDVYRAVRPY